MSATHRQVRTPVVESTVEDLEVQRYLLDLALQPIDRFDGFDHIEQIGGSALRYQLNFIAYALAAAQFTRTPAFTGYLTEAQANAITKMTDKRVWKYWATESAIGYLKRRKDPIAFANVMYSGYLATMVGLYETLNEDRTFSAPGGLTLRWSASEEFAYDYQTLAATIRTNMTRHRREPMYPCEPHLIYPICNVFALSGLVMHDRLHNTGYTGDLLDRVRDSFARNAWLRPDHRFAAGGLGLGRGAIRSKPVAGNDAELVMWLDALMPDLADRTWHAVRTQCVSVTETEVSLQGKQRTRFDAGNYNWSGGDAFAHVFLMGAAAEMGDTAIAAGLDRGLHAAADIVRHNGARRFRAMSTLGNAHYALARFLRGSALSELVRGEVPAVWRTGPILSAAAYPDVLVARAVTDGAALDLVLHPGAEPCRATLHLARLTPHRRYHVTGAIPTEVTADNHGCAVLTVDLADRRGVVVRPD